MSNTCFVSHIILTDEQGNRLFVRMNRNPEVSDKILGIVNHGFWGVGKTLEERENDLEMTIEDIKKVFFRFMKGNPDGKP